MAGNGTIWASGTSGAQYVIMQNDGNLVLYDDGPVWGSGTYGNPGAYLKVQNNGMLVN